MCLLIVKDCQSQSSRIVCVKGNKFCVRNSLPSNLGDGVVITSLPSLFLSGDNKTDHCLTAARLSAESSVVVQTLEVTIMAFV